jgi:hypothetical protein
VTTPRRIVAAGDDERAACPSAAAPELHFGEIDGAPGETSCGKPVAEVARIDYRRGAFLRCVVRCCPICVAVARALCPEVQA